MKYHTLIALLAFSILGMVGCSKIDSPARDFDTMAVQKTATDLTFKGPTATPSVDTWPKGLVQPEPIRFYRDRVNLVIVFTEDPGKTENGLYVHVTHSSYFPMSDSEWDFQPIGDGVWRYQRKVANH